MNKIKCLHLYYDLMNLYGETGNITGLLGSTKRHDIELEVDNKTISYKPESSDTKAEQHTTQQQGTKQARGNPFPVCNPDKMQTAAKTKIVMQQTLL